MSTLEKRLGSMTVRKASDYAQTKISQITLTADVQSTVTFTDGTGPGTFVIDVMPGVNQLTKELIFKPGTDVTITAAGGSVSFFGELNQK